nr:immunoglobulin heavy chain junction region [Macaca mulatta]MOW76870.1 immunoglobulin heavy chain junction region [Macaca mulatta]MOW85547.1 immunoglobulin heavy chain junction region [Macaca mulatta]MOW86441.1 immunoglobulin heavy chain junction region [Macaca mulatta]
CTTDLGLSHSGYFFFDYW